MAKILQFPKNRKGTSQKSDLEKLKSVSSKIDCLIINALETGDLNSHEMIALLAHRLGTLLRHYEHKAELWHVCEQVLKKQASLEKL